MSKVEPKSKSTKKSPSPSPRKKTATKEKKVVVKKEKKEKKTTVKKEKKSVEEKKTPVEKPSILDVVNKQFDELLSTISAEIESVKTDNKNVGVKYLKSLNKQVVTLRKSITKLSKQKKKVVRKSNNASGFLKPVTISKEIAEFTGWSVKDKHSRVEVTKYICNYIKENDLQDPSDRRKIIPDEKLQNLLRYNPKKDEPLRYYSIQTYLKKHFTTEQKV
jgi:chromatin remodeling complex protein RSC6